MERTDEPITPFEEEIKTQIKHTKRIRLYFKEKGEGRFDLYIAKAGGKHLAVVLPSYRIPAGLMINQSHAQWINTPIIPTPSRHPTIDDVAIEVFSYLIPRFYPFAEGNPVSFYRFDQNHNREKPEARIRFQGNLAVITHPNQEPVGNH